MRFNTYGLIREMISAGLSFEDVLRGLPENADKKKLRLWEMFDFTSQQRGSAVTVSRATVELIADRIGCPVEKIAYSNKVANRMEIR